ncbi:hypothetical protein K1T71_000539 [Dendrolimus kikuchii]|uniref:Uncharacterized protein n=1 Tax=Dendrolimus kikuchii TaxID=765133 RepID=A0ACC1DJV9_9NEOP|nr:hypothetical protein K1T71_000539 [Dendrolimus kikuchii]
MFLTIFTLSSILIVVYLLKTTVKPKKFPPGPIWYPIIGSSNVMKRMQQKHGSQFKGLLELAKEYSTDVLGLKLGQELLVVVYGQKNVRQAFTDKALEGRPKSYFLKLRCFGKRLGITSADGPLWREQRQYTVKQLKNVGFGKTHMEKEIQIDLKNILEYIEENRHKPINPNHVFSQAVVNILWKYVAGKRIEEERLKLLLDVFSERSKAFHMAGGLLNVAPWSRFLVPEYSGYNLITRLNKQLSDIIEEAIDAHKKKEVEGPDFIYSYFEEILQQKETFNELQLKVICLDLIIAGSHTTGNSLKFAILRVLREKRMQDLIYEEIQKHIGDNIPCWSDSVKLVYTSAFLLETLRYYTIAPLVGPRRVLEDTVIDGYRIPKDATLLISVYDLHLDPELWDDPHEFKPERFINKDGGLKNPEHLYIFGLGRRRCPGDSLARSFLFIVFVGIMQKYLICCDEGALPSDEPTIGLIMSPKPFSVLFVPRR